MILTQKKNIKKNKKSFLNKMTVSALMIGEYIGLFVVLAVLFLWVFPTFVPNVLGGQIVSLVVVFTVIICFNVLLSNIKDNFFFQLTPEKQCDGGPYMYSSNPEKQKLCAQFSAKDLSRYSCGGGEFHGRPVWYDYTAESNANWKNDRCSSMTYDDPQVL